MNKKSLSAYFSALGKVGGRAKWKGVSQEDRAAHARKMALAMHKKAGHKLSTGDSLTA